MPIIKYGAYFVPPFHRTGEMASILPYLLRSRPRLPYQRERLTTADGDFLDIDWLAARNQRCVILCHGLEGSSKSKYILGMADYLYQRKYDVVAMNYRSCSGEMNRLARFYHSGASEDLHFVLEHVLQRGYRDLLLIGFSLGGNLVLKYLGEKKFALPHNLRAAVTMSAPIDLENAALNMAQLNRRHYTIWFLHSLKEKMKAKQELLPDKIDTIYFSSIRNGMDFDEYYTAPLHGFADAADYYKQNSSRQFLDNIATPTLLINARNDPMLGENCFPYDEAQANDSFHLITPEHGGHVGFYFGQNGFWSRTVDLCFL
jgi:predicted alpha/beta-fold hydrolase